MSVIRRPGLFARSTRNRLAGLTAGIAAAAVEALTVGLWFVLIAVEPRTAPAALFGLCILFCGALLRAVVFEAATATLRTPFRPDRIGVALAVTGSWLCWLFVAEAVSGWTGVLLAGLTLAALLAVQQGLESRVFGPSELRSQSQRARTIAAVGPAALVATGATILLVSARFTEWAVTTPLPLGAASVVLRIEAVQIGVLVFGLLAFLAQQRRFQRLLGP